MTRARGPRRIGQRAGSMVAMLAGLPLSACASGPVLSQLTVTPASEERQPAWSPDGKWIAFAAAPIGSSNETPDLWLASADGKTTRRLTHDAFLDGSPCWSPDGTRLAFRSWREDRVSRIWILSLKDSSITQLTHEAGRTTNPAWSPDGATIAYYGVESGNEQVWALPAAGGSSWRLTHHPEQSWNPAWSPDGSEIVYSRYQNQSTGGALFVMPREGDGDAGERARPLTHRADHRWDRFPSWSPDGRWIAFAATDLKLNWDIWLVSADGAIEERLTEEPSHDTEPSWAPDSRHIVFESDRSGTQDLWILDTGRWTSAK